MSQSIASRCEVHAYGYTEGAIAHPVLSAWSSLIQNVVLPNFTLFGWFTILTEGALALFLFLGLATRFWAVVEILQSCAIYLSVSAQPGEWKWSYWLMAAVHLAILGLAAGRVLGLDQALRRCVTGPRSSRVSTASPPHTPRRRPERPQGQRGPARVGQTLPTAQRRSRLDRVCPINGVTGVHG